MRACPLPNCRRRAPAGKRERPQAPRTAVPKPRPPARRGLLGARCSTSVRVVPTTAAPHRPARGITSLVFLHSSPAPASGATSHQACIPRHFTQRAPTNVRVNKPQLRRTWRTFSSAPSGRTWCGEPSYVPRNFQARCRYVAAARAARRGVPASRRLTPGCAANARQRISAAATFASTAVRCVAWCPPSFSGRARARCTWAGHSCSLTAVLNPVLRAGETNENRAGPVPEEQQQAAMPRGARLRVPERHTYRVFPARESASAPFAPRTTMPSELVPESGPYWCMTLCLTLRLPGALMLPPAHAEWPEHPRQTTGKRQGVRALLFISHYRSQSSPFDYFVLANQRISVRLLARCAADVPTHCSIIVMRCRSLSRKVPLCIICHSMEQDEQKPEAR
jgi:hypothetical protein